MTISYVLPFDFPPVGLAENAKVGEDFRALLAYLNSLPTGSVAAGTQYHLTYYSAAGTALSSHPAMVANTATNVFSVGNYKITGLRDGALATPSIAGNTYTNNGIAFELANNCVSIVTGGVEALRVNGSQQSIGVNGSAAVPTFSFFGDGGAGIFLPVADVLGLAAGTTHSANIRQTTVLDAVSRTPLQLFFGAGSVEANFRGQTTISVSAATKILDLEQFAVLVFVSGNDGSNYFADLLLTGYSGSVTVIVSKTISGSPTARTYSVVSNTDLNLAMASGTYSISTVALQLKSR